MAWVPVGRGVAVAFSPRARGGAPRSAVIDLVQGCWGLWGRQAFRVLRGRIRTTQARRDLDHQVVKAAARKVVWDLDTPGPRVAEGPVIDVGPAAAWVRRRPVRSPAPPSGPWTVDEALRWMDDTAAGQGSGPRWARHRPVQAWLVDPAGRVLEHADNRNGRHRTEHAELRLVQRWWAGHRAPLPAGCEVWVSLQPCRMCAAALVGMAAPGRALRVVYGRADPGRFAKNTALETRGWATAAPGCREAEP